MRVEPFLLERWQSEWEHRVAVNLAESGVLPMAVTDILDAEECRALLEQRLIYSQTNGTPELRAAVAALHPGAGEENVLVCTGSAEANHVCAWSLLETGDEVALMVPNFLQLQGTSRGFGATVLPWRLREESGWAPDLDELRDAVTPRTRLIVVCNPNNPTGAILSGQEMDAIVEIAARHGAWLLADEVYRGSEQEGAETPTFWGRYERALVTGGLSKAYGLPGLRIGWVVGPPGKIDELWGRRDYLTISPGTLSDAVARVVLRPDTRPRILARTRDILRANYPILDEWVRRRPGRLRLVPPRAGAIGFVGFAARVASLSLAERIRDEQGVLVLPGEHLGMDGYLRVGFGYESETLREGLARIDIVLDSL
jgi:aspartate/methionine/tyrosine aminotransferase